jgi:hypothetical protein
MQGARGDLIAREPAQALPFALEQRAGHLDQAVAAPVPRRLAQAIAVGIEAVEERTLHRRPPRLARIEAAANLTYGLMESSANITAFPGQVSYVLPTSVVVGLHPRY